MNEVDNDDQAQKQQYLRENVLEKGYDANEFMEYFKESTGAFLYKFIIRVIHHSSQMIHQKK